MRQIRITKHQRPARSWQEPLPADARDPTSLAPSTWPAAPADPSVSRRTRPRPPDQGDPSLPPADPEAVAPAVPSGRADAPPSHRTPTSWMRPRHVHRSDRSERIMSEDHHRVHPLRTAGRRAINKSSSRRWLHSSPWFRPGGQSDRLYVHRHGVHGGPLLPRIARQTPHDVVGSPAGSPIDEHLAQRPMEASSRPVTPNHT